MPGSVTELRCKCTKRTRPKSTTSQTLTSSCTSPSLLCATLSSCTHWRRVSGAACSTAWLASGSRKARTAGEAVAKEKPKCVLSHLRLVKAPFADVLEASCSDLSNRETARAVGCPTCPACSCQSCHRAKEDKAADNVVTENFVKRSLVRAW